MNPGHCGSRSGARTRDETVLPELLGAAMRAAVLDPAAQDAAMAAFRTARDSGAHGARTRRRDDWRPRGMRRLRGSGG
ncbi:hypothetical protein [Streptomyces poriticola]|uniref:hypothetical protein n=1 Tax=Streptomyces poriticola TaxID=3120506 RepID=UPI002FCE535F